MNVDQIKQDLGTKEMPDNLVYLIDAVRNIFAASNASYADGINVMIALLAEIGDNLEGGNARNDFRNMLMAAYELQVEHLASQTNKTLN